MNAQLYTLVINMVLVLCAGVNPTLKTITAIPVVGPIVSSLSPARWLIEAVVLREFSKVRVSCTARWRHHWSRFLGGAGGFAYQTGGGASCGW